MKNKVSSKDYQPIRFHKGRPHLTSPGKPGDEKDLNEDDPRKENVVEKEGDPDVDKRVKEETTNEERERKIEKSYKEEDESEIKDGISF